MKLYIVFKNFAPEPLEVQGVFTKQSLAESACVTECHFYMAVNADEKLPEENGNYCDVVCPMRGTMIKAGASEWVSIPK